MKYFVPINSLIAVERLQRLLARRRSRGRAGREAVVLRARRRRSRSRKARSHVRRVQHRGRGRVHAADESRDRDARHHDLGRRADQLSRDHGAAGHGFRFADQELRSGLVQKQPGGAVQDDGPPSGAKARHERDGDQHDGVWTRSTRKSARRWSRSSRRRDCRSNSSR